MLKSLDYSVEFPTTGRSFANKIEFEPGLTAITGRNEAGKTLILEMIGYCLFGKDALRGAASDYRNLTATLTFMLLDKKVVIDRAKKEQMWVDDELVAVGAAAINKEVPARLGFGLDVFKIACAAWQGEIGALTEMRPTARLAMVDRLTGLDQLEAVEKECKQEAKTQGAVAQNLILSVAQPVEPVKPDDYEPSLNIDIRIREIEDHQRRRSELLRVTEPVKPVPPVAPEHTDVAALEAHEAQRQKVLQELAHLNGQLAGLPEPRFSREDLQKALDYKAYADEVARRGPKPSYSLETLREWQDAHDLIRRYEASDSVHCPKCSHEFLAADPDLDLSQVHTLQCPPLAPAAITSEFRRHELWAEPLEPVEPINIPNLEQEILAHARADDRAAILRHRDGLEVPADRSGDLRAARAYLADLAVFTERDALYREQLSRFEAAASELAQLADRADELSALRERAASARHYEGLKSQFDRDAASYAQLVSRVGAARELAEGYERGATALRWARSRVKQELAPSLSLAASSLLSSMTNGERRRIEVDHEFNITVDGQPLATLSGSGKSVVNLALRIGLGQVLTSKVLPIFMGDEIDADCDTNRAGSVQQTFQTLRNYLTQVILVTHKDIEADQIICL